MRRRADPLTPGGPPGSPNCTPKSQVPQCLSWGCGASQKVSEQPPGGPCCHGDHRLLHPRLQGRSRDPAPGSSWRSGDSPSSLTEPSLHPSVAPQCSQENAKPQPGVLGPCLASHLSSTTHHLSPPPRAWHRPAGQSSHPRAFARAAVPPARPPPITWLNSSHPSGLQTKQLAPSQLGPGTPHHQTEHLLLARGPSISFLWLGHSPCEALGPVFAVGPAQASATRSSCL